MPNHFSISSRCIIWWDDPLFFLYWRSIFDSSLSIMSKPLLRACPYYVAVAAIGPFNLLFRGPFNFNWIDNISQSEGPLSKIVWIYLLGSGPNPMCWIRILQSIGLSTINTMCYVKTIEIRSLFWYRGSILRFDNLCLIRCSPVLHWIWNSEFICSKFWYQMRTSDGYQPIQLYSACNDELALIVLH